MNEKPYIELLLIIYYGIDYRKRVIVMSKSEQVNLPPEEILSNSPMGKRNFELIILWMLYNNNECEWSHFTEDPVSISQSTLSNYKNRLESKGYIENIKRGIYIITNAGRERYHELSRRKKSKRRLNYPPKAVLRRRNYDHWILWMLYNNSYCKWSDFLRENTPVYINQSSLSKNLNLLMENSYVQKDNKRYKITEAGKIEYSRMLRLYDLDRQSILEEESKRIEEITKKTREFFRKYSIEDKDVKFRFLNNVLKMDYAKVQNSLDDEEDFKKLLLFFSINHPDSYPRYISPDEFALRYDIEEIILKFHIHQIVEKEIYPIKFWSLKFDGDKHFYFQSDEKIERVLRAIVDDYVTKFTYLNKLSGYPYYTMYTLIDDIIDDICNDLFHKNLKGSLKEFLPEYIKYLSYKVETEKQLVDASDKLEGFIYENIPLMLRTIESEDLDHPLKGQKEVRYYLYPEVLKALAEYYIKDIKPLFKEVLSCIDNKDVNKALELIGSALKSDAKKVELYILKSIVLCLYSNLKEAIEILDKQLDKLEELGRNDLIPVILFILSFSHLSIGDFKKAFKISEDSISFHSDHPISHLNRAMVLGYNTIFEWDKNQVKLDKFVKEIEEAISLESSELNISRCYQLKAIILFELRQFEEAFEAIDEAIELRPKIIDYYYNKILGYNLGKRFDEALELIAEILPMFPDKSKHILHKKAYMLIKMGYYENDPKRYEESYEILSKLMELYHDDNDLVNSMVYGLAYLDREKESIDLAEKLVSLEPNNGNYHDSYGEILMIFKHYKKAIELFKTAIGLEPYGFFVYQTFIKMGICFYHLKEYDLSIQMLEQGKDYTHSCLCEMEKKEHWLKKANNYLLKIKQFELNSDED
ncbi:MAG: tetratricopeptide repeat protein [Candidatus Thorarchaeota archaeon]